VKPTTVRPPIGRRRGRMAHPAFRDEVSRIALDALRTATDPLSTTELARRVMTERGLDLNDVALGRTMERRLGACLNHWRRKRGAVRSIPGQVWPICGRSYKIESCQ
jgi:hypothetical protein